MIIYLFATLALIMIITLQIQLIRANATIEQLKDRQTAQENLNHMVAYDLENLYFLSNISYYDFLNFLHKSPQSNYVWTLDEELKLLNFKALIDQEKELRGMPIRKFKKLEF